MGSSRNKVKAPVNGWFPHINPIGSVCSGNTEVWVDGVQVTVNGGNPIWAGRKLIYSDRVSLIIVDGTPIPGAYNSMEGSDEDRWAGFIAPGAGQIDVYLGLAITRTIHGGCNPRFAPGVFGYIHPFQAEYRALIVNDVVVARGAIINFVVDLDGHVVWQEATGTYTSELKDVYGTYNIRPDEAPIYLFIGPDKKRWIVTATQTGTLVRPLNSFMGYRILGDLFYPSARLLGERLQVVGSYSNGVPRFDNWFDFTEERIDLRPDPGVEPPVEPPIEPPIEPPVEPPVEPPIEPPVEPIPVEDEVIAYAAPVPGFLVGDEVDNGNGTVSIQKPNGQYLCVTPEGNVEERATPGGLWESFKKGKASLIAERDGGAAGPVVYVLPLAE